MTKPPVIGRTREEMAQRLAQDIPDGSYVNLGIGIPELVAKFVPAGRSLIYHTENGMLGMGPAPRPGEGDPELINAGKQRVTALPGAAYFHHADSFAMIRGGHLDLCVLGALQVAQNGDLANWSTGEPDAIPAVGGAMDLVAGVKSIFVITQHCTREGEAKLVQKCTFPLTGLRRREPHLHRSRRDRSHAERISARRTEPRHRFRFRAGAHRCASASHPGTDQSRLT